MSLQMGQVDTERTRPIGKSLRELLLALVFLLMIVPLSDDVPFAEAMLRLGITCVLVLSALAVRSKLIRVSGFLAIAAILTGTNWAGMVIEKPEVIVGFCAAESLFLAAMAIAILHWVLTADAATVDSISGVIAAYLLLGLAFAIVYWGMDHLQVDLFVLGPASAMVGDDASKVSSFSQMIYFSFVTMSSLGYGDLTPQTPIARTLAWMQSVTGQFYMAVLVAWIVTQISSRKANDNPTDTNPSSSQE